MWSAVVYLQIARNYQWTNHSTNVSNHCFHPLNVPCQSFHPFSKGYFCKCPASFMGSHCEVVLSPCASNPCLYGGTCVPRADDFYCQCRGQYSGQR